MESLKTKKLQNNLIIIGCIICLSLGFSSCMQKEIYSQFGEIKGGEWDREEVFYFEIDSSQFELNKTYDITIELTNNANYPYRNIALNVTHNLYNMTKDTHTELEYFLADEEGRWYGGGFGYLYQTSLTFKRNYRFTEKRNYVFGITHNMKDNPLKGIERIGISVTENE